MSRYIDVDKISWHKIAVEHRCCNDRWDETYTVAYQSDINDMRTVNIIHCKDCKYYDGSTSGYGVCVRREDLTNESLKYSCLTEIVKGTDYCSRAKRKDGVNNDKKTSN